MPTAHLTRMGHHPAPPAGVTDTFNRADGTTGLGIADTGQAWVTGNGTWGIGSNRARCVTAAGNTFTWLDAGKSDCTVSIDLPVIGTNAGLCMRVADLDNLIMVSCISGGLQVFRRQASNYTALTPSAVPTFASGDHVDVTVSGSNWTLAKNGTPVATWTESFNATATRHGIRVNNDTSARFDNFQVV